MASTGMASVGGASGVSEVGAATPFARKGAAAPTIDRRDGAQTPEEVIAEHRAMRAAAEKQERTLRAALNLPRKRRPAPLAGPVAGMAASRTGATSGEASHAGNGDPLGGDAARADMLERVGREFAALRDGPPFPLAGPGGRAAAAGQPHERWATVRLQMSAGDFLRLKLAGAVMDLEDEALVLKALSAFLDDCGVARFDGEDALNRPAVARPVDALAREARAAGGPKDR